MMNRPSVGAMIAVLALVGAACSPGSADRGGDGGSATGSGGAGGGGTPAGSAGNSGSGGRAGGDGSGGTATGAGGGSAGATGTDGGAGGSSTTGNGGAGGAATGSGGVGGGAAGDGGTVNVCGTGTPNNTAPNMLTVNVDSAQTVIDKGIYGLLMERLGRDITGGLYVGTSSAIPNTNGLRNDVIQAFKDAGVGLIQWPGGCAAGNYNWNPPNPANDVGTDRYMQLSALVGSDTYITGPGTAAAATNNRAWVNYINNNTTHPEWNLKYFKVGNEVWGCGGNQTEAGYETNYVANYNMLSAPINGKRPLLVASTGLIGNTTWLDTEVKNLVSQIDGIEVHDYLYFPAAIPNIGFSDAQYYDIVNRANRGQIGPRLDQIITILDRYDTAKRIKIFEDEWGDWLEPFSTAETFFQQSTVMDAISSAEQLHLFMQHADRIVMAGMAQAINVIHSLLLTRTSDGAMVKTPTFYVWKMFVPHHTAQAKWAPSTLTSENITGNNTTFPVLSAGTTVDSLGHVNISLANVDLVNSRTIQINLTSARSSYIVTSAQIVTGPAKDSYNDFAQAEIVNAQSLAASNCMINGKSLRVTLPSKSVVMLVLTPQ